MKQNKDIVGEYLDNNPLVKEVHEATLVDNTIVTPHRLIDPETGAIAKRDKLVHGYVSTNVYRAETGTWYPGSRFNPNLLTVDGRDFMHAQVYTNSSAGTIGANYLAVTENSGGSSAAHTALAGEITTFGLARALVTSASGTVTHTNDTNSTVFDHTFTASGGTFAAVQMCGTFNAASGVTLVHEATFTSAALADGDKLQIVYTLNLG
jgi:hypothetical protein